jgi:PAS domain S-box-containing protein
MKTAPSRHAARVTLLYLLVTGLWILLSDRLLAEFVADPGLLSTLQTLKGWVFLGLTAIWLYLALNSEQQARAQVEAKLQAVEEEQRALFAAMTDVVMVLDTQRRFIKIESANPAQLPQPPAELLGRSLGEVLPPRPAEAFRAHIQQALETRQPVKAEYTLNVGGAERWFAATLTPLGQDHILWITRDITELKWAQTQLEHNSQQLAALSHMRQSLAASLDLPEVLQQVIDDVSLLVAAERVSILLWEDRPEMFFAAASGAGAEALLGHGVPVNASIAGEVARTGRSLRLSGRESLPPIYAAIERISGYPTQSLLAVPLNLRGEVIGVMEAVDTEPEAFSADDLRVLEAAASWAATAIDNAQQHTTIQRRLRESEALSDISRALNETLDLKRTLQLIVEVAQQIIPQVERAVIHLLDEEKKLLRPAAAAGVQASERGQRSLMAYPGESVAGQVIAQGMVINIRDTRTDPRYLPLGQSTSLLSLLVAPVQSGPRRLGTISVRSAASNAFSLDDERLLAALGVQAAIAIENARLFDVERRRAQEAEALQQVTQTLISRLQPSDLIHAVVEAIATTANYKYVRVFLLEGDDLVLQGQKGYPAPKLFERMRIYRGLCGRVARTGEPAFVPDVKQDEDYQEKIPSVQSAICVPLIHKGETLGVLSVESDAERFLDRGDFNWLMNVSRQLSIAIENARLYAYLERALQQEKQTRAQLVQSEKLAAMGRMVASVAHELNNPIQAMQNALYLVRQENTLSEQGQADLEVAMTETQRMAELIGRLRDAYRPTSAEHFRPESLNGIVKEVQKLMAAHLRQNNVEVELDLDPALPPVQGLRDQLKQAMLNLSLNAVEAMPEGGQLTIRTRYQPDIGGLRLMVSDTGEGIDMTTLPNIFDPFFTTKENGTGLGLALTHDIVERHGGWIEVESRLGHGTTFTVQLPFDKAKFKIHNPRVRTQG